MSSRETIQLNYLPTSRRWRPAGVGAWTLLAVTAYFVMSSLTLPFKGALWLGELPLLTLVQLPKLSLARWLRIDVVMPAIKSLGWSRGSFSPDYGLARPYGLALAYLILLGIVFAAVWITGRLMNASRPIPSPTTRPRLLWGCIALLAAATDFATTLWFADGPGLSIY